MTHRQRRDFLKRAGAGVAGAAIGGSLFGIPRSAGAEPAAARDAASGARPRRRPNILMIMTDYQAAVDGPTTGSPFLDMPALERCCREGAVFSRHFSNAPICMPARYTWITGQYPHTHGEFDNSGQWVPEGSPILMEHLKKLGYHTVGVGKMHFHPIDRMAGFDRRIIADQKEAAWLRDDYAEYLRANGFDANRIYKRDQGPGEFPRIYDFPEDEKFHIDHYVGDQAARLIEEDALGDAPWFLWVSFNGPHSPWDPPKKYHDLYRSMSLPPCIHRPGELDEKPENHTIERYIYSRGIMDYADRQPEKRAALFNAMRAAHYGNLTLIDRMAERILRALEDRGQLDDTLVIWSADHGSLLGDHDIIHKATHYDRSARVPFVVRYPKAVEAKVVEGYSGHVDVFPTLLRFLGESVPPACEGKDLTPLLFGEAKSVQDEVFLEIRNDTTIVTDDWKCSVVSGPWTPTQRPVLVGDLYDRNADPNDFYNLYDDPRHAAVQKRLVERLFAFNPKLRGQVRIPTPPRPPQAGETALEQGDFLDGRSPREAPYQCGRAITLRARLAPAAAGATRGVVVGHRQGPHGYSLIVRAGKAHFVVRRWDQDTIVSSPGLPAGGFGIEASLDARGGMRLLFDGREVARGDAGGPLPVQTGQKIRMLCGMVCVGHARPGTPWVEDAAAETFTGRIEGARIVLG